MKLSIRVISYDFIRLLEMELLTSDEQIPLIEHHKSDFDPKCTFYTKTYRYNRKSRIEKYQCIFFTILL